MQDPTPEEGGLIKKRWIKDWDEDEPPNCEFVIQTYDTAFSTRTTADYSVIQTWGIFYLYDKDKNGIEDYAAHLILLGNIKGRFEYPELRRLAQKLYNNHKPDVCMIEKKASRVQTSVYSFGLAKIPNDLLFLRKTSKQILYAVFLVHLTGVLLSKHAL